MLTDTKARAVKPKSKPYRLADRDGLYLFVTPSGAKTWRYDYRLAGARETLTLGLYPVPMPVRSRRAPGALWRAV